MAQALHPVLQPMEPALAPLHPAGVLPSKVDEFELAGCTKSHENRTSREQKGAVPAQWVREGE